MGNSLRCCLACVLPCGALDVVRVVHLDGQVEEYSRQVSAGEIMAANPNHIISKPCSQGVSHKILILSPESDLKRGSIYFLVPESSLPKELKKKKNKHQRSSRVNVDNEFYHSNYVVKEVASKKADAHRRRRSGRVAVWRPHLESISELD